MSSIERQVHFEDSIDGSGGVWLLGSARQEGGSLVDERAGDCSDERLFALEVRVQGGTCDIGGVADVVEAHAIGPSGCELRSGNGEDPSAILGAPTLHTLVASGHGSNLTSIRIMSILY